MFDKIIFYDQIYNDYDFERINKSIIKDSWVKNPDYDNATRDVFSTSEIDKQLLPDMYAITDRYFNFLDPLKTNLGCKSTTKSLVLIARLCIDIPTLSFCSSALNENPVENENILKV